MDAVSIIKSSQIADAVCRLYRSVSVGLRDDVRAALEAALEAEEPGIARDVLAALIENDRVSLRDGVPLCQDTGLAVAFASMGRQVVIEGATLQEAIDEGVRRAVREGPLRASTVRDPFGRENVGDNTPAIVHLEQVEGGSLTVSLIAKGGGAENMSRVHMLTPAQGRAGVVRAVVETVRDAGANACPPVIVGVGVGGDFETAPLLAKRALLREIGRENPDPELAALEGRMLAEINALGIGPQGFGGRTTALAVLVESRPCHIASLPVAVNVECHSHRHGSVTLEGDRRPIPDGRG